MESVRRIRVEFEPDLLTESARTRGLNRSWYRPRTNVASHDIIGLARALISDFALTETRAEALRLELDGFVLPPHEAAALLRDGDTLHVRRTAAGDGKPPLQSDSMKRSRSARRKAAVRARRRQTQAGAGAPAAPRHGQPVQQPRGGPPAAATAPATSTEESDSDNEEHEAAVTLRAPEPEAQPSPAGVPLSSFMAWAQGSAAPAPGSTRVTTFALSTGQVVSVRLVELLPSGCVHTSGRMRRIPCARHSRFLASPGPACPHSEIAWLP